MLRALVLLAAVLSTLALAACGNAGSSPSGTDPPSNLITPAEVDEAGSGSPKQAFLEYWSALQFQAWTEAVSYFDPGLRQLVGTAAVIGAKKLNGTTYPNLKPRVVGITHHGDLVTIRYYVFLPEGGKEIASITWRKVGGNWQIVYDSRLDAELNQYAENQVEINRIGTLPAEAGEISTQAARAGLKASQEQAVFAEQALNLSSG